MSIFRPSRFMATLLQLALFPAIAWWVYTDQSWKWLLPVAFAHFGYAVIGQVIGHHRYFTHGHFKTTRAWEYFILFFTVMNGLGSPQSYAYIHLVHHRYPDTDRDPHGPMRGLKSVLFCFHSAAENEKWALRSRHLLALNTRWWWVHQYYYALIALVAGALWAIDIRFFMFLWLIPASTCAWGLGISVYLQHAGGGANNRRISGIFGFGERFHKVHHEHPTQTNLADGTGSFDFGYVVSRLFAR